MKRQMMIVMTVATASLVTLLLGSISFATENENTKVIPPPVSESSEGDSTLDSGNAGPYEEEMIEPSEAYEEEEPID